MVRLIEAAIASLCFALVLGGCGTPNVWSTGYMAGPVTERLPRPADKTVEIRGVAKAEILQLVEAQVEKLREWGVAPEDVSQSQEAELNQMWFDGLRFRGDSAQYFGFAISHLWYPEPLNPYDGRLEAYARKIGANLVFVGYEYMGKVRQTKMVPDSISTGSAYGSARTLNSAGGFGSAKASAFGSSVTLRPQEVEVDQHDYVVLFWRKVPMEKWPLPP
jgi:hypothetical protein